MRGTGHSTTLRCGSTVIAEALEPRRLLASGTNINNLPPPAEVATFYNIPDPQAVLTNSPFHPWLVPAGDGRIYRPGPVGVPTSVAVSADPDGPVAADVSPDGRSLYAAAWSRPGPEPRAAVYHIGLVDGLVTRYEYTPGPDEHGVRSLVATRDGVFFTARPLAPDGPDATWNEFAVPMPVRKMTLDDHAFSVVTALPNTNGTGRLAAATVARSADASLVAFSGGGEVVTYEPSSGVYHALTGVGPAGDLVISRDGALVASAALGVRGRALEPVRGWSDFGDLGASGQPIAFSPRHDLLYVAAPPAAVRVYDTQTWAPAGSFPVDELPFPPGGSVAPARATAGRANLYIAGRRETESVVREYRAASAPRLESLTTFLKPGEASPVRVTMAAPDGTTDVAFRGTVRFDAGSGATGLPPSYTFTKADAGTHLFSVAYSQGGLKTVKVTDADSLQSYISAAINVHGEGPGASFRDVLPAGPVTGAAGYPFAVVYADGSPWDGSSIGDGNDVIVSGGRDRPLEVRFVGVAPDADAGHGFLARYEALAPGGRWDAADNGLYTVSLAAGGVTDAKGNPSLAAPLGRFSVNAPAVAPDFGLTLSVHWPAVTVAGEVVPATVTVTNTGNAAVTEAVSVDVYNSADEILGAGDSRVGGVSVDPIPPGESRTLPIRLESFRFLGRAADFHLLAVADTAGRYPELDETNNLVIGPTVRLPALVGDTSVAAYPLAASAGRRGVVTVRLRVGTLTDTARRGSLLVKLLRQDGGTNDAPALTFVSSVSKRVKLKPRSARVMTFRLKRGANAPVGAYFIGASFFLADPEEAPVDRMMIVAGPVGG